MAQKKFSQKIHQNGLADGFLQQISDFISMKPKSFRGFLLNNAEEHISENLYPLFI